MIMAGIEKAANGYVVKEVAYSKNNRTQTVTIHANFESAVRELAKIFDESESFEAAYKAWIESQTPNADRARSHE
jgi:ribosome-binding ATPase YchF (GTP1/OBG family)